MAKKRSEKENTSKEMEAFISERDKLMNQVTELQKQIYHLQLEKDVLEKVAEVNKKRPGYHSQRTDKSRKSHSD